MTWVYNLGNLDLAIFSNYTNLANLANLVLAILANLVNLANLANLINLANFLNLDNLANLVLAIFDNLAMFYWGFTISKTRKHFTETKIFIKISIVFKNLFQSVRAKIKIEEVVYEKKLSCLRKKF